jgi:hypothetical protein
VKHDKEIVDAGAVAPVKQLLERAITEERMTRRTLATEDEGSSPRSG